MSKRILAGIVYATLVASPVLAGRFIGSHYDTTGSSSTTMLEEVDPVSGITVLGHPPTSFCYHSDIAAADDRGVAYYLSCAAGRRVVGWEDSTTGLGGVVYLNDSPNLIRGFQWDGARKRILGLEEQSGSTAELFQHRVVEVPRGGGPVVPVGDWHHDWVEGMTAMDEAGRRYFYLVYNPACSTGVPTRPGHWLATIDVDSGAAQGLLPVEWPAPLDEACFAARGFGYDPVDGRLFAVVTLVDEGQFTIIAIDPSTGATERRGTYPGRIWGCTPWSWDPQSRLYVGFEERADFVFVNVGTGVEIARVPSLEDFYLVTVPDAIAPVQLEPVDRLPYFRRTRDLAREGFGFGWQGRK